MIFRLFNFNIVFLNILFLPALLQAHGFAAYTPIIARGYRQPIVQLCKDFSDFAQGVSSYSFASHVPINNKVTAVGRGKTNCYCVLTFDQNSDHDITCTPSQEFYAPLLRKWIPALQLQAGDMLLAAPDILISIIQVNVIRKPLEVYSLEVEDPHNFFVGSLQVLTHNMMIPAASMGFVIPFGLSEVGGVAGSFFGPITFVGGVALGALIGYGIERICKGKIPTYELPFFVAEAKREEKDKPQEKGKNEDAQAPSGVKAKEKNLPKSGNFPFVPKKTKDGSIPRDRDGGFIDKHGNPWIWDPKKQEWDVQLNGGKRHRNVNKDGMITH